MPFFSLGQLTVSWRQKCGYMVPYTLDACIPSRRPTIMGNTNLYQECNHCTESVISILTFRGFKFTKRQVERYSYCQRHLWNIYKNRIIPFLNSLIVDWDFLRCKLSDFHQRSEQSPCPALSFLLSRLACHLRMKKILTKSTEARTERPR